MLITFQILLMVMSFFMSVGVWAEKDEKLKRQLKYLIVFNIIVLFLTFLLL